MMEDNMMLNSFRRMFPNWDMMSDRERQAVINNSEIQGRLEAQRRFQEAERVKRRERADREESGKLGGKYRVMGGMSATGIV